MNIVITGANRGIGLELARQYLARGDRVYAAVRSPESANQLAALKEPAGGRLSIGTCEVANEASVRAFAAMVTEPVDVLINNAGMRKKPDDFGNLNLDEAAQVLQVNALGPLRVATALLPMLRRASNAKIANISSAMGSIEGNTSGGSYGYRMSKAALNMATRSLAQDLRGDGIIAVVLSPGWVKTDMGGPSAPTLVGDSAAGLISVIDRLALKDSGGYFGFKGERMAW